MLTKLQVQLQSRYKGKKILILGFGREGKSTYHFLRAAFPNQDLFIMDQDKVDVLSLADDRLFYCEEYLKDLSSYEVIFKTAGIPISEPQLQSYIHQGGRVTSQMAEFLELYGQQTIGITGTKGKSTTLTLLFHILKTAQHDTLYGGNIGVPVFELAKGIHDQTEVVLEMSSYQLETVRSSPHIAVFLNFFPEHLNYHQGLENYLQAKAKITQFQTKDDFFFFNDHFSELKSLAEQTTAQPIAFTNDKGLGKFSSILTSSRHLPNIVQQENVLPAVVVAQQLGVSLPEIAKAVSTFQTLPHRLEKVGIFKQITFYDDTLATISEATAAAIEALGKIDVIILGGYDRGIRYDLVAEKVVAAHIPHVLLFPTSGSKIATVLQTKFPSATLPTIDHVETMEAAVKLSYDYLPNGGTVLLSPASPSFGVFKNYEDKSQQYRDWIKKLAE